ncbi:MAG: DUF5333 domain-containing protein [Pseudomonadota bacterium]
MTEFLKGIMTVTLCLAIVSGTPLAAKPPLRDVAEIDDALLDLGIADHIRKNCPQISARMLKAITYVSNLERRARDLGYSRDEIKAYTNSDVEKERLRARAAEVFAARGYQGRDAASMCALGREEIAKDSRIGTLLRAD